MAFEAELVLQRPDDRLDPLPQPVGSTWGLLVFSGRADQRQPEVRAGEERFDVLAGQALVGDHGGARAGAVGGLVFIILLCLLSLLCELAGQANPVTVPSQVTMSISLDPQYQRERPGSTRSRVAEQAGPLRGDLGSAARDRRGIHQPQHLRAAASRSASQRSAASIQRAAAASAAGSLASG